MSRRLRIAVLVGLVALGVVAAIMLPAVGELIEDAPDTLGDGAYPFVAAMAFFEMSSLLGVAVVFEVGVILSGAVAGAGEASFLVLVGLAWAGGAIGEPLNFLAGRRWGRPLLDTYGPRYGATPERVARLDAFIESRGTLAVLVGRFIPFVRSTTPFVVGCSQMPLRRFVAISVVGNLAWAAAFVGLGYGFYRSADEVAAIAGDAGLAVAGLLLVAAVAAALIARQRRAQRSGALP